jgi:tryptophan synthase alpha chain
MSLRDMLMLSTTNAPAALHIYHPLGFPEPGLDFDYLNEAIQGGAQVLELGIPFSDPVADGPVLQQASKLALLRGATWRTCLETIQRIRRQHPQVGLVAMAYANTLHVRGWAASARQLVAAGADAVIVADMPLREAQTIQPLLAQAGLAWIPLVSSTVSEETLERIHASKPPFVYVSSLGVTGQERPGAEVHQTVARVHQKIPGVPVTVGFGIRSPADILGLREAGADGVTIGSALVTRILGGATPQEYREAVHRLFKAAQEPVAT